MFVFRGTHHCGRISLLLDDSRLYMWNSNCLQIVSYVLLRNAFGWIRAKYSTFFAWCGRISLEVGEQECAQI